MCFCVWYCDGGNLCHSPSNIDVNLKLW
jgi:hypothetical protein